MKKNNRKGFTITELVIVIAVIAILAAVLIPTFSSVITKANKNAALQTARNAYTQYLSDYAETGSIEDKVFVVVDGCTILIDGGKCEIAEDGDSTDGYTEMEITDANSLDTVAASQDTQATQAAQG